MGKTKPAGRRRLADRAAEAKPAPATLDSSLGRRHPAATASIKHGAKSIFQKAGLLLLLIAMLAATLKLLSLSNQPRIISVDNNTNSSFLHDFKDYQATTSNRLSGSIFNSNKITVNSGSVTKDLVAKYPELTAASMTVPLFLNRPIIYIQAAKPVVIISVANGDFVVGENGRAIMRGDNFHDLQQYHLPELVDQSAVKLKTGDQALTISNVKFLRTIISSLAAKGYKISAMILPAGTSELDVRLANEAYFVKFNLQSNTAREQAGTFLATINYLKRHAQQPHKYIDARVNGRAYFQ